jgi:nucleotide-binding universal stress UspA family protein
MFKTIIAGSDGHRGRGAAALAQAIATASGARLLLIGVGWELPLPLVETHVQMRETLDDDLQALRDELAPDALTQVALDISPAHALRRAAKAEHADLVVVGSRHHGQLERLTSGDCTMEVLHGAPCAVAVAPDHLYASHSLERIGVGIDGTPESTLALGMAIDLARHTDATVELLAVVSDVFPGPTNLVASASFAESYHEIIDARIRAAQGAIDRALGACGDVQVSDDVRLGDATHELAALSAECDLLVLGSRRLGPVRRLALGSTSERVIRHAACPVLVPARGVAREHDDVAHPRPTTVVF